jgi:VanZ family protein
MAISAGKRHSRGSLPDGRSRRRDLSARRWTAPILWAAIVLTLTSLPSVPASPFEGGDKVVHAVMYGVLAALVHRAVSSDLNSSRPLVIVVAALMTFAALDEWHQRLIAGRSADVRDWIADVAGIAAGTALIVWTRRARSRRT